MKAESNEVEIEVTVKAKTDKAWLVNNGTVEEWVPKSQITDYCEENGVVSSIFLRESYAISKGLV